MNFLRIQLQPSTLHVAPLEFEWNRTSGELRGRDATLVRGLVEDAVAAGEVVSHPYPTRYAVQDPLHRTGEMAVVLGQWWVLSEELAATLTPIADDGEIEVKVLR